MSAAQNSVNTFIQGGYEHGFVTTIESDTVPPGLDEDVIRFISAKKNEPDWMLERLSLIHISEPTRQYCQSRIPSSA